MLDYFHVHYVASAHAFDTVVDFYADFLLRLHVDVGHGALQLEAKVVVMHGFDDEVRRAHLVTAYCVLRHVGDENQRDVVVDFAQTTKKLIRSKKLYTK